MLVSEKPTKGAKIDFMHKLCSRRFTVRAAHMAFLCIDSLGFQNGSGLFKKHIVYSSWRSSIVQA